MRFMVLVPANKDSEAGVLPDLEILQKMGKFNEELVKAGVMLDGNGLQPTSKGARITYPSGDKPRVVDGPFTESKELIAGYWVLQAKSREEVVEWMKRAPFGGGVTIEIRQIHEAADFAPVDKDGNVRAKNAELQKQIDSQKASAKA
ncbi:MAG: YciI family protein [Polyangiaceae bacterium]